MGENIFTNKRGGKPPGLRRGVKNQKKKIMVQKTKNKALKPPMKVSSDVQHGLVYG